MKIIISPAKKMNIDHDSTEGFNSLTTPVFIGETQKLLKIMKSMTYSQLKQLWKCNDSIAALNYDRIVDADTSKAVTAAIFAYDGIQYKNMSPNTLDKNALEYLKNNLRILSGLYGMVSPFDAVIPYRLEMQSKLSSEDFSSLYDFWGDKIAHKLFEDTDTIINLASKEYSKIISDHIPAGKSIITCVFAENVKGKLAEKGTLCKMARGQCVRFMAENNIQKAEEIKSFNMLGYAFSEENSNDNTYTFIKGDN
jgi:cytoplasmic iron level regulating protein YaaA (DUF328/UPF0246 family)